MKKVVVVLPAYNCENTLKLKVLVTYASGWEVTGGTIDLSIEKSGYSDGMVVIKYRDSQNVEAKIQKYLEDI